MIYVDTLVIVASVVFEQLSSTARYWLWSQAAASLAVSDWTITEVASALALKLRAVQISAEQRTMAQSTFEELIAKNIAVWAVETHHFRTAARFAEQYDLRLRSGDALHLAIAADHGAGVQTLDRGMARAGSALGLATTPLS